MTTTDLLAFWGAIVSTIAVAWNVLRDIGDRTKLSVRASISMMIPDPTDRDYLVVTMTNIGRRPIMIKGWGLTFKKGTRLPGAIILPRELPKMIAESGYHMEWTHELNKIDSNLKAIWVVDSHGKRWKAPRKDINEVIKEVSKLKLDKREKRAPAKQ